MGLFEVSTYLQGLKLKVDMKMLSQYGGGVVVGAGMRWFSDSVELSYFWVWEVAYLFLVTKFTI